MIEMTAVILAAGSTPGGLDVNVNSLIQYGVLGLFAILLLLARIVPWSIYQEKKDEIARLNGIIAEKDKAIEAIRAAKDAEIGTLRGTLDEKVIPLAIRLLDVVERPRRGGG